MINNDIPNNEIWTDVKKGMWHYSMKEKVYPVSCKITDSVK